MSKTNEQIINTNRVFELFLEQLEVSVRVKDFRDVETISESLLNLSLVLHNLHVILQAQENSEAWKGPGHNAE